VALIGTSWTVERIEDLVADRASTTVRVEEGRVSGRAGCNQYSGYLQAAGNALRVSETRSTRMACPPPVMQQETRFLTALAAVRTARRDGDRVLLLDETGHVRLRLAPVPSAGPAGPPRRVHVYDCVDGPALAISEADGDAIDAWLPDGRRRLTRVPTASGARYTDDQVSVWDKGTEVLLERDGRSWPCAENQPRAPR
jgi:heat shock protein HslJ/membrane-bound inhibitor of C-type lysozyme